MKLDQAELAAKTVIPTTDKHHYVSIRSYPTEQERQLAHQKQERTWPHIRPNSVLIAGIGFHWKPTCWNKVADMMKYTMDKGIYCGLQEMQDRCFDPYDALGTMRNEAILQARLEGFDWLLMVDNDVMPKPDTLVRLLAWDMPIVAPLVLEPGTGKQLSGPRMEANTGLHPAKWAVLSMLLFDTKIFNCFPAGNMWADAIGADEGFHFMKLRYYGHRLYVDTDTQLVVAGEPLYPLAMNRFSKEDRDKWKWEKIVKNQAPPDRRAIDPFGPGVMPDGDYMPFIKGDPKPPAGTRVLAPLAWSSSATVTAPVPVGWGEPIVKAEEIKTTSEPMEVKNAWGS